MSKETSNRSSANYDRNRANYDRNRANYEAVLSILKARLSDPTPFSTHPDYTDPLDFLRESVYTYYAEQRIQLYTAAGKEADEAEDKLHEKIRACPYLQHKEEGDAFPVSERLIEDINYVIGGFEEVALMEGVKIGMRLIIDAMEE